MIRPIKLKDYKEELDYIKQERANLDLREMGLYCCVNQMKVLSSCTPELADVSPLKVIGFNAAQNCEAYREADDYAVKRHKEM